MVGCSDIRLRQFGDDEYRFFATQKRGEWTSDTLILIAYVIPDGVVIVNPRTGRPHRFFQHINQAVKWVGEQNGCKVRRK
jgi:hypothetical protein